MAAERDWLHVAGCMLYWGEGNKGKNDLAITNSDPDLLRLFLRFLRECYPRWRTTGSRSAATSTR